jgi:hypothetical protein
LEANVLASERRRRQSCSGERKESWRNYKVRAVGEHLNDATEEGQQGCGNNAEYVDGVTATLEKLSCEMAELRPSQEKVTVAASKRSRRRRKPQRKYMVRTLSSRNDEVPEAVALELANMRQEIAQLKLFIFELRERAGWPEDGVQNLQLSGRVTPDKKPKLRRRCFICNDEGHGANRCPSRGVRQGGTAVTVKEGPAVRAVQGKGHCYACGLVGHYARQCTAHAKASIEKNARDCARQPAARTWRNRRCYNCHRRGHIRRQCLEVREPSGAGHQAPQEMRDDIRPELPRGKRVGRVTLAPGGATELTTLAPFCPPTAPDSNTLCVEVCVHAAHGDDVEGDSGETIDGDATPHDHAEWHAECVTDASVEVVPPTAAAAPVRPSTGSDVSASDGKRCEEPTPPGAAVQARQAKGIFSEMRALIQRCALEDSEGDVDEGLEGLWRGSHGRREARRGRWNFCRRSGVRDGRRPVGVAY